MSLKHLTVLDGKNYQMLDNYEPISNRELLERLREAMTGRRLSAATIGGIFGATENSVHRWKRGASPIPKGLRPLLVRWIEDGVHPAVASAGINRHAVGNERVLQVRSSEPPDLESCGGGREAVVEA